MADIRDLNRLGQSIWIDYIRRSFITSGELKSYIDSGVSGVTSNPSIFEKAMGGSSDYDAALEKLAGRNMATDEIYETLAIEDIRSAADILLPVFERTGGKDGYVSIEVKPSLAYDTEETIKEALRLFETIGKANVMIKVPATKEGIPAITALISEGINVNVTLIFSLSQYREVIDAYMKGLEARLGAGKSIKGIASVASFFVSRVDSAIDPLLEKAGNSKLQGKIALANAKVAYSYFRDTLKGERWKRLEDKSAMVQRVLWASTSTKNPRYPDTMYVDQLIGPDTVNTVPPATLKLFLLHGRAERTVDKDIEEAESNLKELQALGIDFDSVTSELLEKGVESFSRAFDSLLKSVEEKRKRLKKGDRRMKISAGKYEREIEEAVERIVEKKVVSRLWEYDYTLWKDSPEEITNRLGWLTIADSMKEQVPRLEDFADRVRESGYRRAVLLGMGGSSLAPEVFRRTFGVREGYLDLSVLDSTDPEAVLSVDEGLDYGKTLFIVSTKSGGTVETLSFFKYFYNRTIEEVEKKGGGREEAGRHFIAITDPGSKLEKLAKELGFLKVFLNDPNIGGRYSALSYFGLVPAALLGIDLDQLLERALEARSNTEPCNCPRDGDNNAAKLGAVMGELARHGADKITFITSREVAAFGDWVEQLIAESTGKEGKGILPVVGEQPAEASMYGKDRLFVYLRLDGGAWKESMSINDSVVSELEENGFPVVHLNLGDLYDLGSQFFLWEFATAVAGHVLGINPFDQPDVESAKVRAREMVAQYIQRGSLGEDTARPPEARVLREFLGEIGQGNYIAIHAYVKPSDETRSALSELRAKLRERYRVAVTVGFGPRFLHSTGQLHKGDSGNGFFVQLVSENRQDLAIPDSPGSKESGITFGILKKAQSLGDKKALEDKGRRVVQFNLGFDVQKAIERLTENL